MCFSAPASFTAAAVLLGLGTVTMRRARSRRELPYAAIPLLFGVQQLLEGMLWLTFPDRAPLLNVALTHLYSFFSHVLWPIYVPLAALALESVRWRRRVLVAIAVAGALVGLYLLAMLVKLPITARVVGQHILYDSPHFYVMTHDGPVSDRHLRKPDGFQPPARGGFWGGRLCLRNRRLHVLCNLVHLGVVLLCRCAQLHRAVAVP